MTKSVFTKFQNSVPYLAKLLNRLKLLSKFNLLAKLSFNDTQIKVPINGGVGFEHLYTWMDHDFYVYLFFKEKIKEGLFMDVGANVGQTALKVNSINFNQLMVCFEPNALCVNYIYELKELNGWSNLNLVPAAIFDAPGIQKFYSLGQSDTGASLLSDTRPGYFNETTYKFVNAISESELSKLILQKVTFLKIDVEGAELNVLKALKTLIQQNHPIIYCEVLDAHNESVIRQNDELKKEIVDFTREIGYAIYRLDKDKNILTVVDEFPSRKYQAENLDMCNYILIAK